MASPHGPRVLALVACSLCSKQEPPPHDEHAVGGCELWRILQPFAELQRQGYGQLPGYQMSGAEWEFKDESVLERNVEVMATWFDAVILPRLSWADHAVGERFVRALHRAGLCVIHETDDDLVSPGINLRIQQTTEPGLTLEQLEQRRLDRLAALRLCDGVTVSSRRLQTVLSTLYDGPIEVVPNAIDARWFRAVCKQAKRVVPGLTIGWAGGARPETDLRQMAEAWGRVARQREQVTFVVAGHHADVFERHVPKERLAYLQWLPVEAYPLNLKQIDVACCAVDPADPFNRCKTPIKAYEATLAGSAVVATPTLYGPVISHGQDGLLAETADQWEAALLALVDDEGLRRRLRKAHRRRVMTDHALEGNAHRWPRAWSRIVGEFWARRNRARLSLAEVG